MSGRDWPPPVVERRKRVGTGRPVGRAYAVLCSRAATSTLVAYGGMSAPQQDRQTVARVVQPELEGQRVHNGDDVDGIPVPDLSSQSVSPPATLQRIRHCSRITGVSGMEQRSFPQAQQPARSVALTCHEVASPGRPDRRGPGSQRLDMARLVGSMIAGHGIQPGKRYQGLIHRSIVPAGVLRRAEAASSSWPLALRQKEVRAPRQAPREVASRSSSQSRSAAFTMARTSSATPSGRASTRCSSSRRFAFSRARS